MCRWNSEVSIQNSELFDFLLTPDYWILTTYTKLRAAG
jgi:hypothetical protein